MVGLLNILTTNETVVTAPRSSVARNCTVIADAAVVDEVTVTVLPPAVVNPAGEIVTLEVGNAALEDESTVNARLPVPDPTVTAMVVEALV